MNYADESTLIRIATFMADKHYNDHPESPHIEDYFKIVSVDMAIRANPTSPTIECIVMVATTHERILTTIYKELLS